MQRVPEIPTQARPAEVPGTRERRAAGWVIVVGIILSLTAYDVARRRDQARVQGEFEWRVGGQMSAISATIDRSGEALNSLRNLFVSSHSVDPFGLRNVIDDLLNRHPGLLALQWAPRVTKEERDKSDANRRNLAGLDYRISDVTADGRVVSAAPRAEYFPVTLGFPALTQDLFFGRDLASVPQIKPLLDAARVSADFEVSAPILNFVGKTNQVVLVVILPVHKDKPQPPKAERSASLRGYLVGLFLVSETLAKTFDALPHSGLDALLLDVTAPSKKLFVYHHSSAPGPSPSAAIPSESEFCRGFFLPKKTEVQARRWSIFFRPAPGWLANHSSRMPYLVLLGGLVITGLLAAYVWSFSRRTAVVERLVTQRTAELVTSNDKLAREIGERSQAERALRESEASLVRAQRIGQIGSWETDLARRSLRWSAETYRIFGRDPDRFVPTYEAFLDAVHHEDVAAVRIAADTAQSVGGRYHIEHRVVRPDGSQRCVVEQAEIVRDPAGQPAKLVGTVQDITERKLIEQALQVSEERLRLAVEGAEIGTWHWEISTGRLAWSERCYRIFGLTPGQELSYDSFLQLLHPEERKRANQAVRLALDERKEYDVDYRIVWPDQSVHWVGAIGRGYYDSNGKPIRMEGIVLDVTARKQAEEERQQIERKLQDTQKLESLGVLAGGVAHDFNNLLTGILGNACLARLDLPEDSPTRIFLEHIESASQRASELCKQMLAYSGKGRFVIEKLDLSALVQETTPLLRLSISKKAILKLDLPENLPPVAADTTQVRQIVMNLVINASEAIGESSGVIQVCTGVMYANRAYLAGTHLFPDLTAGEYVFLEISDTGSGMTTETVAKIFDPFFTTKFTGRGLGLAAVLGIVRGHKGALKVTTSPGRGTCFRMLLPRAEGQADAKIEPVGDDPAWNGSGTVLVVDDEEPVRSVAARMLRSLGFETVVAADGKEALTQFEERGGDIVAILLDLTMPELDGEETFHRLRSQSADVRVILMSGFNEQEAVNRFAGQGLAGFLQKPFRIEALREKLCTVLT